MDIEIRKTFLDYFKKKGHRIMPSSSLIPDNDPSVLLTTAGMQQFKPYYLGTEKPPNSRVATLQKCFRTSDIESVGYTSQHLTFFEMLGNFSFDDYFKEETIDYAMEFILDVLNIPIGKLRIGVFAGDGEIPADEEAVELWKKHGIKDGQIYRYGKEDNFWGPAGDTGPCGPSTEVYYDYGEEYGCGNKGCGPSCDCDRYLEIWNLVFTQYNFNGERYLELPNKNIDTGMGVERIAAVLENTVSVFKTRLFANIISCIEELSKKRFDEKDIQVNKSIRIIADHARAIFFLTSDGVKPSNEGRGYILRRIIRRAIRYARLIGIQGHFLNDIGKAVIADYKDTYNNLSDKQKSSFDTVRKEEERFFSTLQTGSKLLEEDIKDIKRKEKTEYDSEKAFRLYETFGFPVELTTEILKEHDISLDLESFREQMKKHAEISKSKKGFDKKIEKGIGVLKDLKKEIHTDFIGYESDDTESRIMALLVYEKDGFALTDKLEKDQKGAIVLDNTVFFAEGGGQVGDRGLISSEGKEFEVSNTREPLEGLILHEGLVKKGGFFKGDTVNAEVDRDFRKNIRKNHTATHLIHWALRTVFGKDIKQAGSRVSDEGFRFDYSIDKKPKHHDIKKIEEIINKNILNNDAVRCFETTREYAEEIGAISLFGEKYSDFVRVVEIDNYSRELCGGLHVKSTGEVGILKILSDTNIGANTRRIEALTGLSAYRYLNEQKGTLDDISKILDTENEKIIEKVKDLVKRIDDYESELQAIKESMALEEMSKKIEKDDINLLEFDFSQQLPQMRFTPKTIGSMGDELINRIGNKKTLLILGTVFDDKPIIIIQSSKDLVGKGLDCSAIAKSIGKILKGGGGGKKEFAQVGGSDKDMLAKALHSAKEMALGQIKR